VAQPLWVPSADRVERARLTAFRRDVESRVGGRIPDYRALHAWSVGDPAAFWRVYVESAGIALHTPPVEVMSPDPMPRTRWFEGATLNYAQALLAGTSDRDAHAIVAVDETGAERRLTWAELERDVARAAAALRRDGIGRGDRVAACIANVPEAVVLLLACAATGAIFSSCSPDFGFDAARSRFGQIQPRLLVASDGYWYNGKWFTTAGVVDGLARHIDPPPRTVIVSSPSAPGTTKRHDATRWDDWLERDALPLSYEPLPFDHPLYVLYSSGTTGMPKAIVHRAGGALVMHHKEHRLHCDIHPGDVVFYFTTCGWMMWNWLVSALAQHATIVLYDGSPSHPFLDTLWHLAGRLGVTHFGTSARFIHGCASARLAPSRLADLRPLRAVLSTGSPLSPSGFEWAYRAVKDDLHLASISGGTDIVACFMLGVPTEPVYAGQIQAPGLGVDVAAVDAAGRPVVGAPGELVCRKPLPSMPLVFWGDRDFARYTAAYFDRFPGVWHHGDLIEITPEGGIVVYGRSDATLNPGGVRIGTAEIYRPLDTIPEITDVLAVARKEGDDEVVWLFVVLAKDVALTSELERRIRTVLRTEASPRHVPKRIFQATELPRTRSGKTMEVAVSRLVNGRDVPNREAMANPEALEQIAAVVKEHLGK
jgi:acetoacetyl-CoA synthetase